HRHPRAGGRRRSPGRGALCGGVPASAPDRLTPWQYCPFDIASGGASRRWHGPGGQNASVREWLVAGGLVENHDGLLLVQNRRRDGSLDWSPPGGVIDVGGGESV